MPSLSPRFWETKTLLQLSADEWEALCDGCGKCCLAKLEYEDESGEPSGMIEFTAIACRLLDPKTGRCCDYANRFAEVPECVKVTAESIESLYYMPPSCAYRRLAEGKPLPAWHPLLTGDPTSVERAGHSVKGRVVSETSIDDEQEYLHHIIEWPNAED